MSMKYFGTRRNTASKYDEIEGLWCYRSVQEIDGPVDLAIVFVPAKQVFSAVKE